MASGSSSPASTSDGVGTAGNETPTASSMPTKAAPSGTGAVPAAVSGPVTPAYARPFCRQNTRPTLTPATEVISVTRSLVQLQTSRIHDESDPRVSNRSCITKTVRRDR